MYLSYVSAWLGQYNLPCNPNHTVLHWQEFPKLSLCLILGNYIWWSFFKILFHIWEGGKELNNVNRELYKEGIYNHQIGQKDIFNISTNYNDIMYAADLLRFCWGGGGEYQFLLNYWYIQWKKRLFDNGCLTEKSILFVNLLSYNSTTIEQHIRASWGFVGSKLKPDNA